MTGIPGQNVLSMALTCIAKQGLTYYQAGPRSLNDVGQYVTTFGRGILMYGSWQPVPRALMIKYGLDLQKDYFTFYTSNNVLDLDRSITADQISFNGQLFQVESDNDWFALDGWKGVLCVHVGPDNAQRHVWGFGSVPSTNAYSNFDHGNFLGSDIN